MPLTETQREAAMQRLYNGGYPSQIVVEALLATTVEGGCAICGYSANWRALQVVVPPGGPSRKTNQEYRYWQLLIADLDKRDYQLRCYNCSAIERRAKYGAPARLVNQTSVYVYQTAMPPQDMPEYMAWAEAQSVPVYLVYNNEVWTYKPRAFVHRPELAKASGLVKIQE